MIFFFLCLTWLVATTKKALFWFYLWQLKEYHLGRFWAHFKTDKGRQLISSKANLVKLIVLLFAFASSFPFLLLVLYLGECYFIFKGFKKIKKPVITQKTGLLLSFWGLIEILIIFYLFRRITFYPWLPSYPWLLIFDLLIPLIVSLIVFTFQPIAVLLRNKVIKKAKEKRACFDKLIVVGITGSYGKSSVKEFLATILSSKFKVLKTKKNENSEMGISRCILNDLLADHQVFVCEMGAYGTKGIKLLADIAQPKIGIITGINQQHLATFGSQENIIKAKFELIESLPENGVAVLNNDNYFISSHEIENQAIKKVFYSIKSKNDIWAENIRAEKEFIVFDVFCGKKESAQFKVNLFGSFNVPNILAAVAVAKELKMKLKDIAKACEKIQPHGIILKKNNGLNIFNATYSANPDSVLSHLDYLKVWPGKKILVMPCLIELGSKGKTIHKKIGKKIAEVCDMAIITTKEYFVEIKKSSLEKGSEEKDVLFLSDPDSIIKKIKSFAKPGDVVLLESRVPNKVIKNLNEE